jgi:uncharacterized protein involved in exopolysaccharide biosynthesis
MGNLRLPVLRALRLHRRVVVLILLVGLTATAGFAFLMPRIFVSRGSLLLRIGRENVSVDPTVTSDVTVSPGDRKRDNEINSEVSILRSQWLLEKVLEDVGVEEVLGEEKGDESKLPELVLRILDVTRRFSDTLGERGLTQPLTREQRALRSLDRKLTVQPIRNSDVIELSYGHRSAERAREILQTLLHLYLDRHLEVRLTQGTLPFFESQVRESEAEVAALEQRLRTFRDENRLHSIPVERDILLQKVADVDKEATDFEGWAEGERKRRERFEQEYLVQPDRLEAEETTGKPNYGLTPVYERLARLVIEETSLASRFTDAYPPLRDVREQLVTLRSFLAELPSTLTEDATRPNQVRINLGSEIVHAEARIASLEEKRQSQEAFLGGLRERLQHLERLELDDKRFTWEIDVARRRLSARLDDMDKARTSSLLDLQKFSNVSIFDPPGLSPKPEGPSRLAILALGLLSSVLLAGGVAVILEYLDKTFKSSEEISELLRLPTVATVGRRHGLETFARV